MFKRVARRVRKSEQETRAIPKKRQVDGSDDSEQEDVSDDVSSSSEEDVADEESDNDDDDDDDSVSSGSEDEGEGSSGELLLGGLTKPASCRDKTDKAHFGAHLSGKRKRTDDGDDDESGSESSSSAAPAGPSLTIAEALENPIFYLPNDDDDEEEEEEMDAAAVARAAPTGCVLCPGKEMKNPYMVEVHLTSKVSFAPSRQSDRSRSSHIDAERRVSLFSLIATRKSTETIPRTNREHDGRRPRGRRSIRDHRSDR